MPRKTTITLGLLTLLLATWPALAETPADPWQAARAEYKATDDLVERVAIVKTFLDAHPEHPDIAWAVDTGAYMVGELTGDKKDSVDLVVGQLDRTKTPELRLAMQVILLDMYGDPDYADRLPSLVDTMYPDTAVLSYVDHLHIIESATTAEVWRLVDEHCKLATPIATPEQFAADYPDRGFSAAVIEESGNHRAATILTFAGWSHAKQGDLEGALQKFEQAEPRVRMTLFNTPDSQLDHYWGMTLVQAGQEEAGLAKLILAGMYGGDDEATEMSHKLLAKLHPGQDYDDYTWAIRQQHAPIRADWQAVDYDDQMQTFANLKGDRATLIAFWSPT